MISAASALNEQLKGRSMLLLFAALVVGAPVSCSHLDVVSADQFTGSRFLELNDGGAFGDQVRFLLGGSELVAEIYRYDHRRSNSDGAYRLVEQKRVPLGPAQARRLWKTVDEASIAAWRPRYEPSQLGATIYDGRQWSVRLRDGERVFSASGDNTYPSPKHFGTPTLDGDRNAYSKLLGELRSQARLGS